MQLAHLIQKDDYLMKLMKSYLPVEHHMKEIEIELFILTSFRKLKHKTQVFIESDSDYYRTRLTHSLEVAQIARSLCRALKLNEDLGEVVSLSHDLGHPPFGHNGEKALNLCMENHGGFNHNDQTLRVITKIEKRHPNFDGLNLTWESLEGIVKHNGVIN